MNHKVWLTREFSKLAGKFSFSETDYPKLRLSNRLGEVPEFYDLGNMSNIVHIPISFLEKITILDDQKKIVNYIWLQNQMLSKNIINKRKYFV
jgi:hypothetical protein